jgi:hypothetical protein
MGRGVEGVEQAVGSREGGLRFFLMTIMSFFLMTILRVFLMTILLFLLLC